jgi:putative acetyltransferase
MLYPQEWVSNFVAKNGVRVTFRPEEAADTELLWNMFSTLSAESVSNLVPPFTRARIDGWTNNIDYNAVLPIVAVLSAGNAARIIVTYSLKFYSEEVFRHKAELGLTIHDDYQNLGVGTALLNHMLIIAKTKNLTKVTLTVNCTNKRALHLYKKAGFEIEGTLHKEMFYNNKYLDEYRLAYFFNK